MAKRPSLAESLMASLNKGVHVDTAAKIARGFSDEAPSPPPASGPVVVVEPVEVAPVVVMNPVEIKSVRKKMSVMDAVNKSLEMFAASSDVAETTAIMNNFVDKPATVTKISEAPLPSPALVISTTDSPTDSTTESASNRANEQASKQADKQTSNRASKQASESATEQTTRQPHQQAAEQTTKQPIQQASGQPVQQPIQQPVRQPLQQPTGDNIVWLPLTRSQGETLLHLYDKGGLTSMNQIVMDTGIAYGTARSAMDVLKAEGYLISKRQYNGHAIRGFEYVLNTSLCELYVSRIRGDKFQQAVQQPFRQTNQQAIQQPNQQATEQAGKQATGPFSSSSLGFLEEKPTTKTGTGLLDEPELRFWAGEGVTEKQVATWQLEFQMTNEEIVMSLRYGRFDILERNDVQSSPNWFYKILTRNGFYPKPVNYRSLLEIRAEALKQQQERDKEARDEIDASEFKERFKSILADPAGEIYQQLYAEASAFAKEDGGFILETELKTLFRKHLGLDPV